MKPSQSFSKEAKVVSNRILVLVEAVRDDETRNYEKNINTEPSVVARPLQPWTLPEGEVEPADRKSGKPAQSADDSNLWFSNRRQGSEYHPAALALVPAITGLT